MRSLATEYSPSPRRRGLGARSSQDDFAKTKSKPKKTALDYVSTMDRYPQAFC
jgi:hypothetical protein